MATPAWIESAAHTPKPPIASEWSDHLVALPAGDRDKALQELTDARVMIQRLANRHDCDGLCDKPEHAHDVAAGLDALQALGLAPYTYAPGETDTLTCTRCATRKRRDEFAVDRKRASGRTGWCRPCCADYKASRTPKGNR